MYSVGTDQSCHHQIVWKPGPPWHQMSDCCALGSFLLASVVDPQIKPDLGVKSSGLHTAQRKTNILPTTNLLVPEGSRAILYRQRSPQVEVCLDQAHKHRLNVFCRKVMAKCKNRLVPSLEHSICQGNCNNRTIRAAKLAQSASHAVHQIHWIKVLVVEQMNLEKLRSSYAQRLNHNWMLMLIENNRP